MSVKFDKYYHITIQRGCMVHTLSNTWLYLSLHVLDRRVIFLIFTNLMSKIGHKSLSKICKRKLCLHMPIV